MEGVIANTHKTVTLACLAELPLILYDTPAERCARPPHAPALHPGCLVPLHYPGAAAVTAQSLSLEA